MRLLLSIVLGSLVTGCGVDGAGDPAGPGSTLPDAAIFVPSVDARTGNQIDANQGGGEIDADVAGDVIHASCVSAGPGLRIAVAAKFQSTTGSECYPEPGIDASIILLPVGDAAPGQTVQFSPELGGQASTCPADQTQQCENFDQGEVTFDTYEPGGGASGTFSLGGGAVQGTFNASRCTDDPCG